MRLFIVRHGQSTNNVTEPATRVEDPALTDIGQQQARLLADYLKANAVDYGITHLYASPMKRALQTAYPIADALDLPIHVWPEICEQGGIYLDAADGTAVGLPGLTRAQIGADFPRAVTPDVITDAGWWGADRGRETEAQAMARALQVAHDLNARAYTDERIMLVTHGLFLSFLLQAILRQLPTPLEELFYKSYNTSVAFIQFHETQGDYHVQRRVWYTNNVAHLPRHLWTE